MVLEDLGGALTRALSAFASGREIGGGAAGAGAAPRYAVASEAARGRSSVHFRIFSHKTLR